MSEFDENIVAEENIAAATQEKPKKKKKAPIIALICVIAAVISVVAFAFGPKEKVETDPLFYCNYEGVYMQDVANPDSDPVLIAPLEGEYVRASDFVINSEKTEVLFMVTYGYSYETADLYRYKITTPEVPAVKIIEDVISYVSDDKTGVITCTVGEQSRLVQYREDTVLATDSDAQSGYKPGASVSNFKETIIAEGVYHFVLSADKTKILYTDNENSTYLFEEGKEPILIKTSDEYLDNYDADFTVFYVTDEEAELLYKVLPTGERELVDEAVYTTYITEEKGYYLKSSKQYPIKDLFEDDMLEADSKISKPADSDSDAYELYTQKVERDYIRKLLLDPEAVILVNDVYYYDGKESKLAVKDVFESDGELQGTNGEADFESLFCTVIDFEKIQKVSMSAFWEHLNKIKEDADTENFLEDAYDLEDCVIDMLFEYMEDFFLFNGDTVAPISIRGFIYGETVDYTNDALYLEIQEYSKDNVALYRFPITEEGLGKAECICENISFYDEVRISPDNKIFYVEEKMYEDDESDYNVYYDSKLIAEHVEYAYEPDFENGIVMVDKYRLKEDGTPDFESNLESSIIYLETGEEISINKKTGVTEEEKYAEIYYSACKTPAGKTIILKERYDVEWSVYNLYLFENGEVKDLGIKMPMPELVVGMNESLEGYGLDYLTGINEDFVDDDFSDDLEDGMEVILDENLEDWEDVFDS